jgi:hypothetical protein
MKSATAINGRIGAPRAPRHSKPPVSVEHQRASVGTRSQYFGAK